MRHDKILKDSLQWKHGKKTTKFSDAYVRIEENTNTKRALRDVANIDPEESSNGIEQP